MRTRRKKVDGAPRYRQAMTANLTVVLACLIELMWPLSALAETFTLTQITRTTSLVSGGGGEINATGTRIAVLSMADLTGSNPDGNLEIFLFDTTTSAFTQITDTSGRNVVFQPIENRSPAINANGTRIAFESNDNFTEGNADGNQEIFLFDTTTRTFTQITNTAEPAISKGPTINAAGTRIAFVSNADLTGGNADGNQELFLFDIPSGAILQLTNSSGGFDGTSFLNSTTGGSMSADGTRITFSSDRNLTGNNADGNGELYFASSSGGNPVIAPPPPPPVIPTLSEWGQLSMIGLFHLALLWTRRRRWARLG